MGVYFVSLFSNVNILCKNYSVLVRINSIHVNYLSN